MIGKDIKQRTVQQKYAPKAQATRHDGSMVHWFNKGSGLNLSLLRLNEICQIESFKGAILNWWQC